MRLHELEITIIKHEQELAMAQADAENVDPVRLGGNVAPKSPPLMISAMILMLISTDMKVMPRHMVGLDQRGPLTLVPY